MNIEQYKVIEKEIEDAFEAHFIPNHVPIEQLVPNFKIILAILDKDAELTPLLSWTKEMCNKVIELNDKSGNAFWKLINFYIAGFDCLDIEQLVGYELSGEGVFDGSKMIWTDIDNSNNNNNND